MSHDDKDIETAQLCKKNRVLRDDMFSLAILVLNISAIIGFMHRTVDEYLFSLKVGANERRVNLKTMA